MTRDERVSVIKVVWSAGVIILILLALFLALNFLVAISIEILPPDPHDWIG